MVLDLQQLLTTLLLRMVAVEAALLQKPLLTDTYTATPYTHLLEVPCS